MDWYLAEQDNLRTAIQWTQTTGDYAAFADLATTTAGHWDSTGNWADAEHWLQAVADHPEAGIRRCDAEYWLAADPMALEVPQVRYPHRMSRKAAVDAPDD